MLNRVGRSLWPDYKTPHGLVRCTVEDTAILKHLFGCPSCLGTAICHEDFVKTLDMEPQHYLPCDKITVFKNWKICFGEMPMPSSFQVEHTRYVFIIYYLLKLFCFIRFKYALTLMWYEVCSRKSPMRSTPWK